MCVGPFLTALLPVFFIGRLCMEVTPGQRDRIHAPRVSTRPPSQGQLRRGVEVLQYHRYGIRGRRNGTRGASSSPGGLAVERFGGARELWIAGFAGRGLVGGRG